MLMLNSHIVFYQAKMANGGVPVVNRLNSLSGKFFMTGQGPNFSDHDHRTGSLFEPNGYEILASKLEEDCEVMSAAAEARFGLNSSLSSGDEEYLLREINDENWNEAVDLGFSDQDLNQSHPDASPLHIPAGSCSSQDTSHSRSVQSLGRFSPGINTIQEASPQNSPSLGQFSPENTPEYTSSFQGAYPQNSISSVASQARFSPAHPPNQFVSVEILARENNNNTQEAFPPNSFNNEMTEDRRIDELKCKKGQKNKFIELIVADEDRIIHFKVKKTTLMVKLKKSYSDRVKVPITSVRFLYEGRSIKDDDTSISLQMEPKDVIEVELTSTEGSKPKVNIKQLEMDWASDEDIENEPTPAGEMLQIDGNGDLSSSSSDEFDYGYGVVPKRRKIEVPESKESSFSVDSNSSASENSMPTDSSQDSCSDLEIEGDRPDENSNEVSLDVEEHVERGSLDKFLDNLPSAMVSEDELGRPHIKCPTSGPSYIFFKSCRTKGASISRHCNDILNIAEVSFN